jgi:hypothetical protein
MCVKWANLRSVTYSTVGKICAESVFFKYVMRKIVHIVNCISSQGLNHTKFQKFLSEMEEEHGAILYHTEVRWFR